MKYVPNGPLEKALALAALPTNKPASQHSTRLIVVAGISLIIGASVMYIVIKKRNKNQEVNTDNNKG